MSPLQLLAWLCYTESSTVRPFRSATPRPGGEGREEPEEQGESAAVTGSLRLAGNNSWFHSDETPPPKRPTPQTFHGFWREMWYNESCREGSPSVGCEYPGKGRNWIWPPGANKKMIEGYSHGPIRTPPSLSRCRRCRQQYPPPPIDIRFRAGAIDRARWRLPASRRGVAYSPLRGTAVGVIF